MTNNNWIEEFDKEFRIMHLVEIDEVDGTFALESDRNQVKEFISNLLTKKDQEHKAELEMIKGEILSEKVGTPEYNQGIQDTVAILNSHINKISTE